MASILKVNTIQDATNSNTALTINSSGLIAPKIPTLQVEATNTDQSVAGNNDNKVEWETVVLDNVGGWSTSDNRYTPTVAGYYLCGGSLRINLSSVSKYFRSEVRKNGTTGNTSLHNQLNFEADRLTNSVFPIPTGLVQLDGASDYIEVYVRPEEGGTLHDDNGFKSFFFATLVHAT